MTRPTTDQIQALAAWDTPALSNALDSLRLRDPGTGHTDGSVRRITGSAPPATAASLATAAPMVGRVVTARMVARSAGDDGIPVSRLHRAIAETEGPVVVVLQDCDRPPGAGAFLGEVNGSLLAALGISGLVTDGRVRDVDELRGLPYPVYARGLCVGRSHMRLTDVGSEVTVAGLTVRPGDLVHGDEHGVLHIPAEALPGILDKAELIRRDEQELVRWARSADFSVEKLLTLRRVRH